MVLFSLSSKSLLLTILSTILIIEKNADCQEKIPRKNCGGAGLLMEVEVLDDSA
jgi:hypothetical protein